MTHRMRGGRLGDTATDRLVAQLAQQMGGVSRRSFLRGAGMSAMAVTSSG